MTFPAQRPRRLRRTEALRSMTRETRLSTSGYVYPMFVGPGKGTRVEISSMPGIYQQSVDQLVDCLLYTSPSPRDLSTSRMPSSA